MQFIFEIWSIDFDFKGWTSLTDWSVASLTNMLPFKHAKILITELTLTFDIPLEWQKELMQD